MCELDAGGAVAAERGPQSEDHPSGLEEADLVIGLPGPAPAKRFVEGARTREIGHAERHQADPLFHGHDPPSITSCGPPLPAVLNATDTSERDQLPLPGDANAEERTRVCAPILTWPALTGRLQPWRLGCGYRRAAAESRYCCCCMALARPATSGAAGGPCSHGGGRGAG